MSAHTLRRKIARLQGGEVLTDRDYDHLEMSERFSLRDAEREALMRLNPEQRLRRARSGRLSRYQLNAWAALRPREVPWVNGDVPPWIAPTLIDICEEGMDDG